PAGQLLPRRSRTRDLRSRRFVTAVGGGDQTVQVIPMISYEDVGTAAEWLISAFGFQERVTSRHTDDGGTVTHAQVDLDGRDGTLVMLGCPGSDYHAPRRHAAECEHARKWLEPPYVVDGVLVYVNDVEAHQKRARAA